MGTAPIGRMLDWPDETSDESRLVQALTYCWNLRKEDKALVRINYTERRRIRDILGRKLCEKYGF